MHNLKKTYGITQEDYETLFRLQNGRCAICGTTRFGGRWKKLSVDHSHAYGNVRGLLCHHCNAGLGAFRDSERRLVAAIRYLSQFSEYWSKGEGMLGSQIKVKVSGHATVTYPPEAIERRLKELATMEQTEEVKKEIELLKEYQK